MASPSDRSGTPSAGHMIVRSLEQHGVERVYVVPGESYLDVLDGLHDSTIETVVCRHEGGAAYMAEGIVTLAGSRLYTSAAYTEEMIDDVLARFDRVLSACAPLED